MWTSTKHRGVEERHEDSCRSHQGVACSCECSFRVLYRNAEGQWDWLDTFKSLEDAVEFRSHAQSLELSWTVVHAMAQIDAYGWQSVPPWLAMSVQMVRNGYGCASCPR